MNNAKFLSGYVKLLKTLDLTNVEKNKEVVSNDELFSIPSIAKTEDKIIENDDKL